MFTHEVGPVLLKVEDAYELGRRLAIGLALPNEAFEAGKAA